MVLETRFDQISRWNPAWLIMLGAVLAILLALLPLRFSGVDVEVQFAAAAFLVPGLLFGAACGLLAALPAALLVSVTAPSGVAGAALIMVQALVIALLGRRMWDFHAVLGFWLFAALVGGLLSLNGTLGAAGPIVVFGHVVAGLVAGLVATSLAAVARRRPRRGEAIQQIAYRILLTITMGLVLLVGLMALWWALEEEVTQTDGWLQSVASGQSAAIHHNIDQQLDVLEQTAATLTEGPLSPEDVRAELEQTLRHHRQFVSMLVTDADGRIASVAAASGARLDDLVGQDVSDRPYFGAVRDGQHRYVSAGFRGRGVGSDLIAALSVNLPSETGFAGVVEASIMLEELAKIMARSAIRGGALALTDQQGTVLASTLGATDALVAIGDAMDLDRFAVVEELPVDQLGWTMTALRDQAFIAQLGTRWALFLGGVSLIVFLLCGLCATVFSRRIAGPVAALNKALRRRRGDPNVMMLSPLKLSPDAPREIQSFVKRVNVLLGRVSQGAETMRRVASGEHPIAPPFEESSKASDPSPPRFLILEDNEINREMLRDQLRHLGFDVVAIGLVADLGEALALGTVDVALIDLQLADGNGYEVAQTIRKTSDPMLVAVTAQVDEGIRSRCQKAGFDRVLEKPPSLDDLAEIGELARAGAASTTRSKPGKAAKEPTDSFDAKIIKSWLSMKKANRSEIRAMVDRTLEQAGALRETLASASGDHASLVHKLKGRVAVCGGKRVAAMLGEFEAGYQRGRTPADSEIDAYEAEVDRFRSALEATLAAEDRAT